MDTLRTRVYWKNGLHIEAFRGQFILLCALWKGRWGLSLSIQIHHHWRNFDKCLTIGMGKWDGEVLRLIEIQ